MQLVWIRAVEFASFLTLTMRRGLTHEQIRDEQELDVLIERSGDGRAEGVLAPGDECECGCEWSNEAQGKVLITYSRWNN